MACSGHQLCFTLGGKKFCICIPLLIEIDWLKWRKDPRRFIEFDRLKVEDIIDIQVLATISDLATQLSAERAREIQKGVATQMDAFNAKLGGEVTISQFKQGKEL